MNLEKLKSNLAGAVIVFITTLIIFLFSRVIIIHMIVVSGFVPWYGGHSCGPRYSAGLVPWFSLLGILAVDARLRWRARASVKDSHFRWRTEWTFGAILLFSGMTISMRWALRRAARGSGTLNPSMLMRSLNASGSGAILSS